MPFRARMAARDAEEAHRASTPLELFFDLVFVIAVGQAASGLHHGLVEGDSHTVVVYLLVFFAIWWAWMNFTWFASAYDTDDVPYRIAVFVIMIGVLILAAGLPRVFAGTSYGVLTLGYVVMRTAMVALWVRVAVGYPPGRASAVRYAIGIAGLQVLWVGRLALPETVALPSFLVLAAAELAVPLWAEAAGQTSWHPGHIAERYGLFTIIVLGESLVAATVGVQAAWDADVTFAELAPVVAGGLLTVFSMWWLYFDVEAERVVTAARDQYRAHGRGLFAWGYGHYIVFASAAAVGAGLEVAVGEVVGGHGTEHGALSSTAAALALTVPVAVYLLAVVTLHAQRGAGNPGQRWALAVASALIVASSVTSQPVLATGVVLSVLVASSVVRRLQRAAARPAS